MRVVLFAAAIATMASGYAAAADGNEFRSVVRSGLRSALCDDVGFQIDPYMSVYVNDLLASASKDSGLSDAELSAIVDEETQPIKIDLISFSSDLSKTDMRQNYKALERFYTETTATCFTLSKTAPFDQWIKPGDFQRAGVPLTPISHMEFKARRGDLDAAKQASAVYGTMSLGRIDDVRSAYWTQFSADRGDTDEQLIMAYRYKGGTGVKKDLVKALTWALIAASNGNEEATEKLSFFRAGLTQSQSKAAAEAAKTWKPVTTGTQ